MDSKLLPVEITLTDGIEIEVKMITESEVGIVVTTPGEEWPEVVWSKDYVIDNA